MLVNRVLVFWFMICGFDHVMMHRADTGIKGRFLRHGRVLFRRELPASCHHILVAMPIQILGLVKTFRTFSPLSLIILASCLLPMYYCKGHGICMTTRDTMRRSPGFCRSLLLNDFLCFNPNTLHNPTTEICRTCF